MNRHFYWQHSVIAKPGRATPDHDIAVVKNQALDLVPATLATKQEGCWYSQ